MLDGAMSDATDIAAVVSALHRFGQERDRLRSALARDLGVAPADVEALIQLQVNGAMTQRELGSRLMLTSGAVTTLVDRLARLGWVARRPNPDDRRSVLVERLGDGDDPPHPALDGVRVAIEAACASLGGRERAGCVALLNDAADAAARAVDELGRPTADHGAPRDPRPLPTR